LDRAEATHELDPNRISHPVIYEACSFISAYRERILGIEPKSTAEPKTAAQLKAASLHLASALMR